MKNINKFILGIALSFGLLTSCSEADLDPTLQQDGDTEISINTDNDLHAVLLGAYHRLQPSSAYGRDIIILGEVFSDNTVSNANSNRFVVESKMDLLPTTATANDFWIQMYRVIGSSNIIIAAEGIEGDEARINQIKGQAYALRALAHFNLVTFYGQQHVNNGGMSALGVPYVTKFKDEENLYPPRNTVEEVKNMAYSDLETAYSLMSTALNDPSKKYITTYAVKALEARISNYFGDFERSLAAAKVVVDSGQFIVISKSDFLNSYKVDSAKNSVFEIDFNELDQPDINGLANIYQKGSYGDVIALPNLVALYEAGDVRGVSPFVQGAAPTTVIGNDGGTFRNIGKYPSIAPYDDNVSVVRFEEVLLLYAEALLETSNAGEALTYLNMIPTQRGASAYTAVTKDNILLERRKELAFEGFRFHDLARTKQDIPNPDPILMTHGVVEYGSYNFAMPIPANENANTNILQNFGYGQ